MSLFCHAIICVHSSHAIILKRNRKDVALLVLSYRCLVTVNVLWLFLTMPWVSLHSIIVVFSDQTHLLFKPKLIYTFSYTGQVIHHDHKVLHVPIIYHKWILIEFSGNLGSGCSQVWQADLSLFHRTRKQHCCQ